MRNQRMPVTSAEYDRRSVLRLGTLGWGGLTLANLFRSECPGYNNSRQEKKESSRSLCCTCVADLANWIPGT
jgi:hypothetical protein